MTDKDLAVVEQGQLVVSDKARAYIRQSLSPSTLRAYRAAWREFEHFAESQGVCPLPAKPETLIDYLTALADGRQCIRTIRVKLSGIAWRHRIANLPSPTSLEAVKALMAGISRELGTAPAKKEPVMLAEIEAMIATLPDSLAGKRNKALLLVGFAGAFRRSELVALDIADLRITADGVRIIIKRSKTDQAGEGMLKVIPRLSGSLCPVVALEAWLDSAGINSGPVFRRVGRHDNLYSGRLTAQSVALVVKSAAKAAGLDWRVFSGHSLRSGFITQSFDNNAQEADIAQQTGHESLRVLRNYRKSTGRGSKRAVMAAFRQSCQNVS